MTKTEQVYGGSLYELAREEGRSEGILKELEQIVALFDANADYWRLLSTPAISKEERCAALDEALGGRVEPYLLNFLKILCENGIIGQLRGCAREYRRRYQEDNAIVEICAVTAIPMTQPLQQQLREKLQKKLGKTVSLTNRVDPGCMGGVLLEMPGEQLDGTVRHRLEDISDLLKKTAL